MSPPSEGTRHQGAPRRPGRSQARSDQEGQDRQAGRVPHRAEGPLEYPARNDEGAYSFFADDTQMVVSRLLSRSRPAVAQTDMFTTSVRIPRLDVHDQWRSTTGTWKEGTVSFFLVLDEIPGGA